MRRIVGHYQRTRKEDTIVIGKVGLEKREVSVEDGVVDY